MADKLDTQVEDALFEEFVKGNLDSKAYLEAYPDVRLTGLDPVKHWLEYGMAEGRFLYPHSSVVLDDIADRVDNTHWKRFTWGGRPVAVRIRVPVKSTLIAQIKAQARHDPAILAVGVSALSTLRQLDGPDLLDRCGLDIRSIFEAITERPDVIVIIPRLGQGEAEKFAADLVGALSALRHKKILVIVTDDTAETDLGWESLTSLASLSEAQVVFWRDVCGPSSKSPMYFARLLNVLRPSKIVVINSRVGLEAVAGFGRGLSQYSKLYCVYFSLGVEGVFTPVAARFPYRTTPFAFGLSDNDETATKLRQLWGGLPGPGIGVLPPRLQPTEPSLFSDRLVVRKARAEKSDRILRWLWVSRVEAIKGTAVLAELARMRPTDQFEVFGSIEGGLKETELMLSNINYRGVISDLSTADFKDYDGFVFTSLFESMPNIVLEMSQHAIPMVLADVGGLRETFDEMSVLFVKHTQDTDSTAKAFSSALSCVAKLSPSEMSVMVEAAHDQALVRHGPDVYLRHVTDIFETPVSHV